MNLFGKKSQTLANVDAAWLGMEDPTNLMMVSGIITFDEPIDFERLKTVCEERLLRYKRFRQRVVGKLGVVSSPRWEDDPHFDLGSHVRRVALPAPGDKATLQEMVSDLMSTPLDYSKPLWQIHLIENYGDGCAIMSRLHHCIADGIALVYVLLSLTDDNRSAPTPPPDIDSDGDGSRNPVGGLLKSAQTMARKSFSFGEKLFFESMDTIAQPSRLLNIAKLGGNIGASAARLFLRFPDPETIFKGQLGVTKRAAWSEPVRLADVKAIGKVTGGTVNDILLTAMTGALRRYLEERGEEVDGLNFRAAVPVNLRPIEEAYKLGNKFGLVFLSLPIGIIDPIDRLIELKKRMDALKNSPEAVVALGILATMGMSPSELHETLVKLFGTKATAVMTNVPGPREPLYLAGGEVKNLMFWVPQSGRLGLGISIISYAGLVRLGVATDAGLVPDPNSITDAFHDEFEELMKLVDMAKEMDEASTQPETA